MITRHERKTLKRERQMKKRSEQKKEKILRETKQDSGEYFFIYRGFVCGI